MSSLLTANLMRLKKSKLFWGLTAAAVVISLVFVIIMIPCSEFLPIDKIMFVYPVLIGFMIPAFVGIFFGTEYNDGTIRNKLMIGHSRQNVYLANVLTALVVAVVLFAACMLPVLLLGIPVVGAPSMGWGAVISMLLVSMTTVVAICSLHVMVSLINSNKASATVLNLFIVFLSFELSAVMSGIANATTGFWSNICRVAADVLPMGQAEQFVMGGTSTPLWLLAIYSVAVGAICAAIGMRVFGTKNIK